MNGRMRFTFAALLLMIALPLAGCSPATAPQADASARHYIDLVRDGDFVRARELLDPSVRGSATDDMFNQLREWLGAPGPRELEQIGLQSMISSTETRIRLVYQLHCSRGFATVDVVQRYDARAAEPVFERVNVTPLAGDLRRINAFTFAGKGAGHYLFLAVAVADLAFMIFALVVCARTPLRRRKWAWILFILVGFGRFTMNWSTGEVLMQLFTVRLPIVGAESAGLYAPFMLWLALPVGAIVFLVRRRKLAAPVA